MPFARLFWTLPQIWAWEASPARWLGGGLPRHIPLQRIVVASAALFLWTVSTKVGSGSGMGRFTTCLSFFCNSFRIRLPEEPE